MLFIFKGAALLGRERRNHPDRMFNDSPYPDEYLATLQLGDIVICSNAFDFFSPNLIY